MRNITRGALPKNRINLHTHCKQLGKQIGQSLLSIALLVMAWVPKELLNQMPAYPVFPSYLRQQFCIILMALKENIFSLLGSVAS